LGLNPSIWTCSNSSPSPLFVVSVNLERTHKVLLDELDQLSDGDILSQGFESCNSLVSSSIGRLGVRPSSTPGYCSYLICECLSLSAHSFVQAIRRAGLTLLSGKIWDTWTSCSSYGVRLSIRPAPVSNTHKTRTISSILPILAPALNGRIHALPWHRLIWRPTRFWYTCRCGCRAERGNLPCLSDILRLCQPSRENGEEG
jgi:hypothetical protein